MNLSFDSFKSLSIDVGLGLSFSTLFLICLLKGSSSTLSVKHFVSQYDKCIKTQLNKEIMKDMGRKKRPFYSRIRYKRTNGTDDWIIFEEGYPLKVIVNFVSFILILVLLLLKDEDHSYPFVVNGRWDPCCTSSSLRP